MWNTQLATQHIQRHNTQQHWTQYSHSFISHNKSVNLWFMNSLALEINYWVFSNDDVFVSVLWIVCSHVCVRSFVVAASQMDKYIQKLYRKQANESNSQNSSVRKLMQSLKVTNMATHYNDDQWMSGFFLIYFFFFGRRECVKAI